MSPERAGSIAIAFRGLSPVALRGAGEDGGCPVGCDALTTDTCPNFGCPRTKANPGGRRTRRCYSNGWASTAFTSSRSRPRAIRRSRVP